MAIRKYLSEFGITMVANYHALTQYSELNSNAIIEAEKEYPFYIYMITSRPRIALKPDALTTDGNDTIINFGVQEEENIKYYPLRLHNSASDVRLEIESRYPYSEFKLHGNGQVLLEGKTAIFLQELLNKSRDIPMELQKALNLEVLYIGQSYGENGSRTATTRLASHSTLQKIYAEIQNDSPDKEIWLVLWNFQPTLLTSFDGVSKEYGTTIQEDDEHMYNVFDNMLTEQQQINYTEAALIRYFQPKYNKTFKDIFPSVNHKTYSQCYDIDLNSVCVELDTEEFGCCLFSECVQPWYSHTISYFLHSREERISMFDFPIKKHCE